MSQTTGTCEGPRAMISVTTNATPAAPTVTTPVSYCQNATATALTAGGTNLLWYTTATGGTGSTTPPTPITATAGGTTFYVSQNASGCEGPRASIVVNVTATPASPTVSSPLIYCQGITATALTAIGSNLLWYTTATGGTGSATAPTPSTATVGSTTYYVSQSVNSCEGPRSLIVVTINSTPAAPAVNTPVTYCQNVAATPLTATGTNLLWYATATGGIGSGTPPTPSTTTAGSITYYVSQTTGSCEGPRSVINVTIFATPAAPGVTSPVDYCQGSTATALSATGTNLLWYTTATGGTGSATAPTPLTSVAGNTTYYVSSTANGCEGPRSAITINVTSTPTAPAVITPVLYCQNITASSLTATGSNLLWYTTSTGGTGVSSAPIPNTATSGNTIYYVSQTINGCEGPRSALTVTVNQIPPAASPVPNLIYCQNATASPLTTTGNNILWYANPAGGIGSSTAPIPSTTTAGIFYFYATQSNNGCESPRAEIGVEVIATPAAPTVSTPIIYCPNDAATALTATGNNLLWYSTATGGTGSNNAPTPSTAVANSSTTYYVSQTSTVGSCEGPRTSIVVSVTNPLTVSIGRDSTICEGSIVKFFPTVTPPATTYQWRALGVPNSTVDSLNKMNATFSPVNDAQYILRASLGGCSAEDTVNVNVRWKPIVEAGRNTAICLDGSTELTGVISHITPGPTGIPISDFVWTPKDSLSFDSALVVTAHPTRSTWYRLTVKTDSLNYGCAFIFYDSVKVIVQPIVKAFAGKDTIAVKGAPHQLQGSGGTSYEWSSPSNMSISNPNTKNPFVTLTNDANFYLKASDAIGCEGLDSVFVKVYNGPKYYVPNAFSPNGDGQNDIFRAIPVGISNTTYFRVFNRYGEILFETNQWLKGWDGTYKGKPQPSGAYVWSVKGKDKDNKIVELQGSVMLVR